MEVKGRRVLVTGADGFIGSHLVEQLVTNGSRVRALVMYNSFNSWGWIDSLPPEIVRNVEVISGDIRDTGLVADITRDIETVFHLAALISIPYSYQAPRSYVETNVLGTLNVLTAARDNGVQRVLITSTSEVYGTARHVPIDEAHPLQGQSPYSASKIGADRLAESFFRTYDLPVVTVRPFNTYGPRQSARAIIPTIITQLLSGAKTISLGALHPTRDLVFVKDTVAGFLSIAAADNKVLGEEINIATSKEISVGDLARVIISLINPDAQIVQDENRLRPTKSEVERLCGANEKIRDLAGWSPKYDLQDGLAETIEWFRDRENLARYKSSTYNI